MVHVLLPCMAGSHSPFDGRLSLQTDSHPRFVGAHWYMGTTSLGAR